MMKVAIVGNSNCVFRNGLSSGVQQYVEGVGGSVENYSLGGSCCAMHIYTLHAKLEELRSADLVILDSLIIDTAHWRRGIIRHDELLSLIDDMYALFSRLPGQVVSLLFPGQKHVDNYRHLATYRAHRDAARKYGIDVVDLYRLIPHGVEDRSVFFMQPGHIRTDLAKEVGYRLAAICRGAAARGQGGELESPYRVINEEVFDSLECLAVSSSHFSASCYRLDRNVPLSRVSGMSLVGALHWNKECSSKLVLSSPQEDDVVQLRSRYAFFEVLNCKRRLTPSSAIRPGQESDEVTQRPAGNGNELKLGTPQLAGLLLRGDGMVDAPVRGSNQDLSFHIGNVFAEALA
jgi:hypothetical protein